MATKLIVLGLLMSGQKYGYEIKQLIDDCVSHYADIGFSSIYYVLDKLSESGYLKKKRKKSGNRPDRHIFEITKKGEEMFYTLLKQELFSNEVPMDKYNIGVSFMKYVDKKDRVKSFSVRKNFHKEYMAQLKRFTDDELNPYTLGLVKRGICHCEAEIKWLDMMIKNEKEKRDNQI